jgi:acyl-CoA hydrolase
VGTPGRARTRERRYAQGMPAAQDPDDAHPPTPTSDDASADAAGFAAWVVTADLVFPHHANTMGTLFGGRALEKMDINSAVACYRFCRTTVVTASAEPIDFRNPVHVGEILEVRSRVVWAGRTSMIVRSEVYGESPLTGDRRLCTIGHMNFVALDAQGRPTPVPPLRIVTEEQRRHHTIGARVRAEILRRRQHDPLEDV